MRLHILCIGFGRGTPEAALTEDFVGRAQNLGRRMGFPAVTCEELAV